jgi:AraC-like DNA-binding protein
MLMGSWVNQLEAYLVAQERPVLDGVRASTLGRQVFTEMTEIVFSQPPGWQWRFTGYGAEMLGNLYAYATLALPGEGLVRRLADLLDAQPEARFTVEELAECVGLTSRQLIYQFQKVTGKPLGLWIRERRMTTARKLLGQGQSVCTVAEKMGFANPYHFSRVFKEFTGVVPSVVSENARRNGLHS